MSSEDGGLAVPPLGPIHHVGVVVREVGPAIEAYQRLGFKVHPTVRVEDQRVDVVPVEAGASWIELLIPLDEESGIGRFLASRGPGMHHVAYLVDDVQQELNRLAAAGVELIDSAPRTGLHGWRVAFIHPRSCGGVLTELVERNSTI